jgi:hypothetical protein
MSAAFDPEGLLRLLFRRKVDYVVIGVLAAAPHGSPLPIISMLARRVTKPQSLGWPTFTR